MTTVRARAVNTDADGSAPEGAPPDARTSRESGREAFLEEENERLRRQNSNLLQALESRSMIDQAIGILMATQHCSATEAWNRLKRVSNDTNTKIRDLACMLTTDPALKRG